MSGPWLLTEPSLAPEEAKPPGRALPPMPVAFKKVDRRCDAHRTGAEPRI